MTGAGGGSAVVADPTGPTSSPIGDPEPDPAARLPAGWALPVVAGLVYVADQASKHWALNTLDDRTIDLVGSLRFNLAFNTGAAFSGGAGWGPLIAVAVVAIVVILLVRRHRVVHTALGTVAVGLIVGGALGNLSDRVLRAGDGFLGGAVVDFVDLQWWPVFNVADAAVVVGGLLLVVDAWRAESR